MKRLRKIAVIFMALVMMLGATLTANAATSVQDGVEVTLNTNLQSYENDEEIVTAITVKNTNNFTVYDVALECIAPEGYQISESVGVKSIPALAGKEAVTLTVTLTPMSGGVTATGDNSHVLLWTALLAVALAGTVTLGVVYRKKWKGMLSLILCLTLVLGLLPANMVKVSAADDTGSISVFETITVDGAKVKVEGVVTYSLFGEEDEAVEESESPEASVTPEASESPEATATPSPEASVTPEASESPEATATPTPSPEVTATPEVSASPEASESPEATATPTPSPETSASPTPDSGTEEDDSILTEDFESYTANTTLPVGTTDTGLKVAANAATLTVVEDAAGNQVLKTEYTGTKKSAESQLDFAFSKELLAQYSSITMEFDAYVEGTSELRPNVRSYDGADSIGTFKTFKNAHFNGFGSENLMPVKIVFDFENGTQTLYVNGVAEGAKSYKLKDGSALTEGFLLRLRLTAMNTGDDILLDNIVISGVEKDSSGDSSTGDDTTTDDNTDYTQPESGDGVNVLLDDNFEGYAIDDDDYDDPSKGDKGWTGSAINAAAAMQIVEETTENQVLKAFHGNPAAPGATTRNPRVEYLVSGDYTNITLDIDVKISEGQDKFGIHAYQNDTNKTKIGTLVSVSYADCAEWTHIKIIFDLENNTQKVYVGGEPTGSYTYKLNPEDGFKLYFSAAVAADSDNSYVMIDNALITTTDEIQEGIVAADKSINWDKVVLAESEKTGLLDVMDTSHPRIYVNDWSEIKAKVAADKESKAWYDTIITFADAYLDADPVAYIRNSRGNINDCSTAFKNNIIPVAAAACLADDADKKAAYKARVYEELEAIGNWSDWGSDAYLCTAHIIFAYALCYDWMYDQWTDTERTNIENWMLTMGMSQAILNYEGINTNTSGPNINTTINNWNNVCNGSNMVGAIALAGELTGDYAGVPDYIIAKAAAAIPNTFVELTEDGAYAEPLSYWDYGIRHQVKLMAALDSCLAEGTALPAILDFGNVNAADAEYKSYAIGMSNTGGFPIYYNGTTGSFNYGDGTIALVTSPIMYWLSNKFEKSEYSWYNLYMMNNNEHVTEVSAKDAALSLVWYDPDNSDIPEDGFDLDKFYSSYEAAGTNGISMRSSWEDEDALYVAVHAGDETVAHSNLDAGGFVLDWNNQRWVHMYGRNPGGYTNTYGLKDYNTKKESGRYQYYNTRGEANNTIIAYASSALASGNIPAVDMDIDYFAAVEKYESGVNTSYGIVDMTDTNSALYTSAKRGVMLTGYRDIVVVQDEITAKEASDFYWFVNTNAEITISADGKNALWEINGDRMLVRITQALTDGTENSAVQFGIMNAETLDFVTLDPTKTQVEINEHKMYIHVPSTTTLNLTVEFVPLEDGEGIPEALDVTALANWSVDTGANPLTSQTLGDIVAILPGSPNAYVKGAKTQVNTADTDVKTVSNEGTIYVPADFVTEVFGEHTLATTVFNNVNYVAVSDVANAFGKVVTADSTYGLVFIAEEAVSYDADTLEKIYDLLDIRVFYEVQNKAQSLTEDFENCTVGTALSASGTGLEVTTDNALMTIGEANGNKVAQTGGFTADAASVTSKINFALTPDILSAYDKLEISMNVQVEGNNTLELRVRTNADGNIGNFKTVKASHMPSDGEMVPVTISFDFANNSHQLTFNGKAESAKTYSISKTDGFLFALWMNNSNEGGNVLVDDIVITGIDASGNRTELRKEDFESYKDNTTVTTKVVTWLNKVDKKADTLAIASVNEDKMIKATHVAKASSYVVNSFTTEELASYRSVTVIFDTMVKGISEMALNVLDPNDTSLGTFKTLKAGVSNFATDKWYNVKIVFDLENGTQTLSLKAADAAEYTSENAKSYTWKDDAKTSLANGFKLRLNITDKVYGGAANTNGVLIDNMVITGEPKGKHTGEITFFDPEITEYYVQVSKSQEASNVSAASLDSGRTISAVSGNPTSTVTVDGVNYNIHFVDNPFEGLIGTGSAGVASSISLGLATPLATPSEQTWISVQHVTSSIGAWEDSANYIEEGTIDGIISTLPINRWSANGHGNWICYDLGSAQTVYSMAIAGYNSSTRQYIFKIEYSTDGENWTTVVEAGETTAGNDHEVFNLGGVTAQYIKVTGTYASNSTWIGINEVRIYGSEEMQNADQNAWIAYFYPETVYGHAGDTVALKLIGYDASGNEVSVDISAVTFTSANESVATVDENGVITLAATGTTTVQAEMTILGVAKTATIDVIVQ